MLLLTIIVMDSDDESDGVDVQDQVDDFEGDSPRSAQCVLSIPSSLLLGITTCHQVKCFPIQCYCYFAKFFDNVNPLVEFLAIS